MSHHRFRVSVIGALSSPNRGQIFAPMPPKPQQQFGEDGRQSFFLGCKVLPSEVKKAIEESTHSKRFLAVIDHAGICQMQCRGCKKNLSAANIYQTARSHADLQPTQHGDSGAADL